jgi:hypothetical protein
MLKTPGSLRFGLPDFSRAKKPVVGFELAESGHSIGFPGTNPDKKIDLGDSVIARENSQKTDVRAQ